MKKLSEREWMVLGTLWGSGGATLGAITQALQEETNWSRNTVLTYLTRMEAKGLVRILENIIKELEKKEIPGQQEMKDYIGSQ